MPACDMKRENPVRNKHTDVEKELVDTGGKEKVGWIEREHWNIYITMCKTDSQWEFSVWQKELNLVLCDNLER